MERNGILHGMECKSSRKWNIIIIMAEWNGNQGVSYLGKHGLASAWRPVHQHVAIDTSVPTSVDGC